MSPFTPPRGWRGQLVGSVWPTILVDRSPRFQPVSDNRMARNLDRPDSLSGCQRHKGAPAAGLTNIDRRFRPAHLCLCRFGLRPNWNRNRASEQAESSRNVEPIFHLGQRVACVIMARASQERIRERGDRETGGDLEDHVRHHRERTNGSWSRRWIVAFGFGNGWLLRGASDVFRIRRGIAFGGRSRGDEGDLFGPVLSRRRSDPRADCRRSQIEVAERDLARFETVAAH